MKEKISQQHARYRPVSVGEAGCFNCKHARSTLGVTSCETVEGKMEPAGVCIEWSMREPTELDRLIARQLRG